MPYEFIGHATITKKLDTGDYSLEAHESQVAVERKSKIDAWNCAGHGRTRFKACLERLGQYACRAVVIEACWCPRCPESMWVKPHQFQARMHTAAVAASYLAWSTRLNIPIHWCHSRAMAERTVLKILGYYYGGLNDPRN